MIAKSDEDVGMPENPIYPNFSEYLWKAGAGRRVMSSPNRSHGNTGIARPPQNEPSLARIESQPLAEESIKLKVAA
ncbi:MAG: hypothetical protein H0U81_06125 [Pyrinomonadaceae bacterium]|nr:hypothetical protein [Pyrinomonadaceae bacterium]